MIITQNISLDVSRENAFRVVHAKQYDKDSRYLKIKILEHGTHLKVTHGLVYFNVKRADGASATFDNDCQINSSDGTVTVKLPSWLLAVSGEHICNITLTDSNCSLSTLNFVLRVEEAPNNGNDIIDDERYDIFTEFADVKLKLEDILSGKTSVPKADECTNVGSRPYATYDEEHEELKVVGIDIDIKQD